jgi:hypothetical protein
MAKLVCKKNQHVYDGDDYLSCPSCSAFSEAKGMNAEPELADEPDELDTHRTPRARPRPQPTTVLWGFRSTVDPVVGWLVATKGPAKGKDYTVRSGNNTIGRGDGQRIYIPEDKQIHTEHAIITYDPNVLATGSMDQSMFDIQPVQGIKGLLRIQYPRSQDPTKWLLVSTAQPLHRKKEYVEDDRDSHYEVEEYPKISLGATELMFVPFCGIQFAWKMELAPGSAE